MDDLLLFTPSKKTHIAKQEDLLKALLKNGLKISPIVNYLEQNCSILDNTVFMQETRVCVKPLWSRLEVIQKL